MKVRLIVSLCLFSSQVLAETSACAPARVGNQTRVSCALPPDGTYAFCSRSGLSNSACANIYNANIAPVRGQEMSQNTASLSKGFGPGKGTGVNGGGGSK